MSFMLLILFQNCVPLYSELQDAKTVGYKKVEITPFFSTINLPGGIILGITEDDVGSIQNGVGAQVAFGIADRIDLRGRIDYSWTYGSMKEDYPNYGTSFLIGPKFSLVPKKLALFTPLGKGFSPLLPFDGVEYYSNSIYFIPTFLITAPLIRDKFELTVSPKAYIPLSDEILNTSIVLNTGIAILGIHPNLK